jgi:hypothetical protein
MRDQNVEAAHLVSKTTVNLNLQDKLGSRKISNQKKNTTNDSPVQLHFMSNPEERIPNSEKHIKFSNVEDNFVDFFNRRIEIHW